MRQIVTPERITSNESSPWRHWSVPPDDHPRPPTPRAGQRIELGASGRDSPSIRQLDGAAFSVDGGHKVPLRVQVSFDEQLDVAHERITALGALTVKEIAWLQSQNALTNRINSTEVIDQR